MRGSYAVHGKRVIEGVDFVRDMRSGMSHADLMTKYDLSRNELEKTVERLGVHREALAIRFAADIRAGMSDVELMQKHQISSKGLQTAFVKLVKGHFITRAELEGRLPDYGKAISIENMRKEPRTFPSCRIPICDGDSPHITGSLYDVSENGIGIEGLDVRVDEMRNLVINEDEFGEFGAFRFEARCKWARKQSDGSCLAGFEITDISMGNFAELRLLIRARTINDPAVDRTGD